MNTTTTPDVPLPADASSSGWAEWDNECRVITATNAESATALCRHPQSSYLAAASKPKAWWSQSPAVSVETHRDHFLTSAESRELAAAIVDAADEVDDWVGR
jgi:hypothetical protein